MRLFLLPKTYRGEETVTLTGKDYNYIVNVLRLKNKSRITGRDAKGNIYNLEITDIGPKSCTLSSTPTEEACETTDALPQDRPVKPIVLYQCLPKGRKAEEIIKRATEIGVTTIVLVKSRNVIADISGKEESRLERYNSMIEEAIQQSGSTVPTKVEGVIDISEVPSHFEKFQQDLNVKGVGIILHQEKLTETQSTLAETLKDKPQAVGILVGAEGGFTDKECSDMTASGFKPVLLKTNILRCETASIYAISASQALIE